MKETEKLTAWAVAEKAKGLVDIKFYPGESNDTSVEQVSKSVLQGLMDEGSAVDISNDRL